jgi:4-amino-4-deoxy-L-arabinose transferase-like glycosyltransferase
MKNLIKYFKKNQETIIIIWIFLLALSLRLFRLPDFIAYHQDQVRDLFYVKDYFSRGQIFLLGPKASVGNFFLPPFWYYLMAIGYIFSPSPVVPAFIVALLSALTTIVIYKFCKKFFFQRIAFFASLIYAVSHVSIEHSRFAWNPNPIPFFTILTLYFLYVFIFEKKEFGFYLGLIFANLAFQLHYQGMVILVFFFLCLIIYRQLTIKRFFQFIGINLLMVSPFLIYEVLNHFSNSIGIFNFIFHSTANQSLKFFGIPFYIKFILKDFSSFLGKTLFFKNFWLGFIWLLIFGISLFFKSNNRKQNLLKIFFIFSFVMLFIYKNSLIDFYLLFLIPPLIIYFVIFINKILPDIYYVVILSIVVIVSLFTSPTFSKVDQTYPSIAKATKIITSEPNYCLIYDIFPANFIESKFRYLVSLQKNQPKQLDCETILYYRCDQRIKDIFYLCDSPKCQKTIPMKLVDQGRFDTGVKIYQLKF